ncbi:MAG TPA: flagellar hook-length control protein FliK [Thermoclostridium caenicola]|nr:flagellar hook-length control protein FliK [Thermoclostridium caenicola]HPU45383.1 flagellar hook-length control protein FliK [Thermoclostridium sp.]
MDGSILASMMISGAAATGRTGTARKQEADGSFSGILAEKMQESRTAGKRESRAGKATGIDSRDRPGVKIKTPDNEQSPDVGLKPDAARGKGNVDAKRDIRPKADTSAPETEKADGSEKEELINELILLLETLFTGMYATLSGDDSAEVTDAGALEGGEPNQLTAVLQSMLGSRLDRLQELLDRIRSTMKNVPGQEGFLALLDEIETLISKMQGSETGQDSALGLQLEIMSGKGGEDIEGLISQLENQCREIADKLRTMHDGGGTQDQAVENSGNPDKEPIAEGAEDSRDDGKLADHPRHRGINADKATDTSRKAHGAETGRTGAMESDETIKGQETIPQGQQVPDSVTSRDNPRVMKAESTGHYLSDKLVNQTVTSQVTMKIRLMAGENKQELEMQLKPDSLGKLTLKLTHERGQVLARITAENEQVKSILENNMQLLKDALERNGYSVQSLEVSVGNQDSGNRQAERKEKGRQDHIGEPVARPSASSIRRLPESGLYHIDIPGISQQIDLIA